MFVTDFVQIFCFWSSFLAAELTRTRGHKWVVVRSGLLLFFVVQIVSFLQCSIFLKIKNPWLDLSLPNLCASACHSFWREAGPVWHVRQRCWHVLYLFFFFRKVLHRPKASVIVLHDRVHWPSISAGLGAV